MASNQLTPTEKVTENFDKIKTEGDIRFRKITQIIKDAIISSVVELRAEAAEVSPATKEFKDAIVQRIKETSKETLEEAQEVWQSRAKEDTFQDWLRAEIQAVVNAMKTTLKQSSNRERHGLSKPPESSLG